MSEFLGIRKGGMSYVRSLTRPDKSKRTHSVFLLRELLHKLRKMNFLLLLSMSEESLDGFVHESRVVGIGQSSRVGGRDEGEDSFVVVCFPRTGKGRGSRESAFHSKIEGEGRKRKRGNRRTLIRLRLFHHPLFFEHLVHRELLSLLMLHDLSHERVDDGEFLNVRVSVAESLRKSSHIFMLKERGRGKISDTTRTGS